MMILEHTYMKSVNHTVNRIFCNTHKSFIQDILEELKETILAYSFLNRSKYPLASEELDDQMESWFKTKLDTDLDFDVKDALFKLKNIGLGIETNGKWEVIPLDKALIRIDEIWDGVFEYNQK